MSGTPKLSNPKATRVPLIRCIAYISMPSYLYLC